MAGAENGEKSFCQQNSFKPSNIRKKSGKKTDIFYSVRQQVSDKSIGSVLSAAMAGHQDLSDFERGVIIGAREMGHSISEVAMKFGFSHTTISRVYREYRVSGKTSNFRHRCGRKRP
ncbi:hypothetical protein AVEN_108598-1 [Araneus ventricosus]|uniref:Tc3 transposase DNA binding domain-containing protein n=1 Tax=Araneus ventricosus TaxID=182803 RepID=A0A4Y2DGS7_ARAVE|nr:hypothetical protein AVEN_108598-1 [Araneus ventricosus]